MSWVFFTPKIKVFFRKITFLLLLKYFLSPSTICLRNNVHFYISVLYMQSFINYFSVFELWKILRIQSSKVQLTLKEICFHKDF